MGSAEGVNGREEEKGAFVLLCFSVRMLCSIGDWLCSIGDFPEKSM